MDKHALTLYFDGRCAFCAAEMRRLGLWDQARRLAFIDVAAPGFDPAPLGVTLADLNRELHALDSGGRLLVGLDSMLAAYTLVGRGWIVLPLRVGWLRPPLAALYRAFARNRYRVSDWLGFRAPPRCADGVCEAVNPFLKK